MRALPTNPRLLMGSLLAFVLLLAFAGCQYIPFIGGEKPTIVFSDEGYDTIQLNNAIARFVIENGYGYPTETVVTTGKGMQDLIVKGDIDIEMEGWQHNRLDWYNDAIRNEEIENLGLTYESGPQFFMIPQWMADQYGIRTVEDMKDQWELLKDPNDTSRGLFITCPKESGCFNVNSVKMEAYGLDRNYNLTIPENFGILEVLLENAQVREEPVFGYYWEPAKLNEKWAWHILEEPIYSDDCWEQVRLASQDKIPRPIDAACEYPRSAIDKLANIKLSEKAPDVVKMLRRMNVGLEPIGEILKWATENNVTDPEQMAIRYLETYQTRYREWMKDENYIKVQKKVRERRGY